MSSALPRKQGCSCRKDDCSSCSCRPSRCTLNCACGTRCQEKSLNSNANEAKARLESLVRSLKLVPRDQEPVLTKLITKDKAVDHNKVKIGHSNNVKIYDSQKCVAKQLEELMSREFPYPETVAKLRVLYVCPPMNNTYKQTDQRVADFQCRLNELYGALVDFQTVKVNPGKKAWNTFETFARDLALQRNWFFLILHDECHWGAGAKSQADLLLATVLRRYNPNWKNLRLLDISATSWNQIPYLSSARSRILAWKELDAEDTCYVGVPELLGSGKIIEWDPDTVSLSGLDCWPKSDENAFKVMLDWCCALIQASGLLPATGRPLAFTYTEQTLTAVNSILGGGLALLRLPGGGWGKAMFDLFTWLLSYLGLERKACCVDATMNSGNKLPNFWAANLHQLQRVRAVAGKAGPIFRTFQDLEGLPCLVIVVEKGRMGDTMPTNLTTVDLRARYVESSSYASLLQDVGRAAGWIKRGEEAHRPTVLVNPDAMALLKTPEQARVLDRHLRSTRKRWEDDWMNRFESTRPFASGRRRVLTEARETAASRIHPEIRFILSAEPQIGKTGTVLYLVELLCRRWSQSI